jgi:hypothetical protein
MVIPSVHGIPVLGKPDLPALLRHSIGYAPFASLREVYSQFSGITQQFFW